MLHDTRQVDCAAFIDEKLGSAQDLRLRLCAKKRRIQSRALQRAQSVSLTPTTGDTPGSDSCSALIQ